MVSVLGHLTRDFADTAETLGLTPLVEVADADELAIALGVRSGVIAVNSRDLRTLEVDPARAHRVLEEARRFDVMLVAASGVTRRSDVEAASASGADAVLVGETLMRASFPEDVLAELTGVRKGVRQ
jgi:indole-3-glycerol phosphate synthase